MKSIYLGTTICILAMLTACKNGTSSTADTSDILQYRETEDVYAKAEQVEYVMIFPSDECIERRLHEAAKDSVDLENFYLAHDDLVWYYHLCRERLEEMGAVYYETYADKSVHYPDLDLDEQRVFRPDNDCECGVLILDYVHEPEFIGIIDFLTLTEDTIQYPRINRQP